MFYRMLPFSPVQPASKAMPAHVPSSPRLQSYPLKSLCQDFVHGVCKSQACSPEKHAMLSVSDTEVKRSMTHVSIANFLTSEPRKANILTGHLGPGHFNWDGERHDNDFANVDDIKILPTTDEVSVEFDDVTKGIADPALQILCNKPVYMPRRDMKDCVPLGAGPRREIDFQFRTLRQENVEGIIDVCHHGLQQAVKITKGAVSDQWKLVTHNGVRYSFFQDATVTGLSFNDKHGAVALVRLHCPKPLRGRAFTHAKVFEDGMLCSLLAVHDDGSVNVIHCNVLEHGVNVSGHTYLWFHSGSLTF